MTTRGTRGRIVVTGASGLLGSHAARALEEAAFEVVRVDRAPAKGVEALDLGSDDASSRLERLAPAAVVHAAAVLPPRLFGEEAEAVAAQNRRIDDAVLQAIRSVGCDLAYLSGTSLYGCVQTPCTEDSPVTPRGPYLEEKRRTEERILEAGSGAVLRVASPYSVGQRAMTVLRRFVELAVRGQDLTYFGTGAREQDFIAAEDIAVAITGWASCQRPSGVFNIASGRAVGMRELAELVIAVTGARQSRARAAGASDPEEHCRARIVIEKAKRELGFQPKVTLEEGILRLAAVVAS